jgi:hypothetical protein
MIKKLTGLLFGFLLSASFLNAQTADAPTVGDGSSGSPYQITNINQLYWITRSTDRLNKYYKQMADIDAYNTRGWNGGAGWVPIGTSADAAHYFSGEYDGNGHTVSNLYINSGPIEYAAFFGYSSGIIKNLGLIDISITENVNTGSSGGGGGLGGIVGLNDGGTITGCFVTGTIIATGSEGSAGGIAGYNGGDITDCYAWCRIDVSGSSTRNGGLVGYTYDGLISNCYAAGQILSGETVSGFAAQNDLGASGIVNCYYDADISGQSDNDGRGEPKSTVLMQSTGTFSAWDGAVWSLKNGRYPLLKWQITKPYVFTNPVNAIGSITAIGNGNLTDLGTTNPTAYGVCWNTSGLPTIADGKADNGATTTEGAFTASMTGLSANTVYYVRAFATNASGTSYGGQVSFKTAGITPVVTTEAVSNIAATAATGNLTITNIGVPTGTAHGVCWNTAVNPTTANSKTNLGAIAGTGSYTTNITGLSASTTYHVRAYATNTEGTAYGDDASFKTAAVVSTFNLPANGTYKIGDDLIFTANFSEAITVNTGGGVPYIPVTLNTGGVVNANYSGGTGTSAISFAYRIVSGNYDNDGISVGGSITGNGGALTGSTNVNAALSLAGVVGATGNIKVDGVQPAIDSVSFPAAAVYTTTQNIDIKAYFTENVTVTGTPYLTITIGSSAVQAVYSSGSGTGILIFRHQVANGEVDADGIALSANISLNGGTIKDAAGNDAVITFSAKNAPGVLVNIVPPTLTTSAAASVNENSATLGGNITADGGATIIERGVVYSSGDNTPTIGEPGVTKDVNAAVTDLFGKSIGSLSASTTYYFQAYASNLAGTNYGGVNSFKTAPGVSSVNVPANGTYKTGDALSFTVNFSEAVLVNTASGTPSLRVTLNTGGTVNANYANGSGTAALSFSYTIISGDLDGDGITLGNSILLNGGTIKRADNADAGLTLNSVGNTTSVLVDGVAPTVSLVTPPSDAAYSTAQSLSFKIRFDENVTVTGGPYISINIGGTSRNAGYSSGSGTNELTFSYTVVGADADADGISMAASITLNGGSIKDAAGNNAVVTFTAPSLANVFVNVSAPAVTTQAASAITSTTATWNGNITGIGVPGATDHGFCWNTTGNPSITDSIISKGAAADTGAFTAAKTWLAPNTRYYVKAYAKNSIGTNYGAEINFITDGIKATVITNAVSGITSTTATGNGKITDIGIPAPTQYGVVWSAAADPTVALLTKTAQGAVADTGVFTSNITGLSPNTLYHVKAYATNSAGTAYGTEVTFTTKGVAAAVSTVEVTNITTNTATCKGDVTSLGVPNPAQHGVVWSASEHPLASLTTKTELGAVAATGQYTNNLTGLQSGTVYYVRAYAINIADTVYGDDIMFSTVAVPPTIQSTGIYFANITETSFTVKWSKGNGSKRAVFMKEGSGGLVAPVNNTAYTAKTDWADKGTPIGATGYFCVFNGTDSSVTVTGLLPATLYRLQVFEYNNGTGGEKYYTINSFDNPDSQVTVSTPPVATPATALGSDGFTANWTPVTTALFYRLDAATDINFLNLIPEYTDYNAGNNLSLALGGLLPSSQYYYRVRAVNAGGTSRNSNIITVTTNRAIESRDTVVTPSGFTVKWNPVPDANDYLLDYSTESFEGVAKTVTGEDKAASGKENALEKGTSVQGQSYFTVRVGNTTSYVLTGLAANTVYYYRVRAENSLGVVISVSPQQDVKTATPVLTNGSYEITIPAKGTRWQAGKYCAIEWKRVGGMVQGAISLEYSTDNGGTWQKVTPKPIAGIARYQWLVPNVNSKECLIRLANFYTNIAYDITPNPFEIYTAGSAAVNYPNPFNPSTRINFSIEKRGPVSLRVYNNIGQEVALLVNRELEAGFHEFEFDASKLPSGVYYYNLIVNGEAETHKMLLLK